MGVNITRRLTLSGLSLLASAKTAFSQPLGGGSGASDLEYQSSFPLTETRISEGGRWHNNGLDWNFVQTADGKAFGTTLVPIGYADPYAYLSGFGSDHTIEATIFRDQNARYTNTHEVELHLRKTDRSHISTGYECGFPAGGGTGIVRWNGAVGDFTFLTGRGPNYNRPFVTGDVVKARISGSNILIYVNGTLVLQGNDATFATGSPGIGFFARADTYAQYCFTRIKVTSP
jgi:hypothetical protein